MNAKQALLARLGAVNDLFKDRKVQEEIDALMTNALATAARTQPDGKLRSHAEDDLIADAVERVMKMVVEVVNAGHAEHPPGTWKNRRVEEIPPYEPAGGGGGGPPRKTVIVHEDGPAGDGA